MIFILLSLLAVCDATSLFNVECPYNTVGLVTVTVPDAYSYYGQSTYVQPKSVLEFNGYLNSDCYSLLADECICDETRAGDESGYCSGCQTEWGEDFYFSRQAWCVSDEVSFIDADTGYDSGIPGGNYGDLHCSDKTSFVSAAYTYAINANSLPCASSSFLSGNEYWFVGCVVDSATGIPTGKWDIGFYDDAGCSIKVAESFNNQEDNCGGAGSVVLSLSVMMSAMMAFFLN